MPRSEPVASQPLTTVLFDLDGTLTDPEVGITASYRHALAAVGRPVADDVDLSWMIGPPIGENLHLLGVTAAELPVAVQAYRRRHLATGLYEVILVPGMAELVRTLHAAGVRLALATGKPTGDGELTLKHFGLATYFAVIAGNTVQGLLSKADVVADALRLLGSPDPARVAMVGDRRHDVEGAAANGITSIGVGWGFAADGELATAGADQIVTTVDELARLLLAAPAARTGPLASDHPTDQAGGRGRRPAADTSRRPPMAQQEHEDAAADRGAGDDAKTKFRAALDRKKAAQHRTADGQTNTGNVHGSETSGPVQRTFRRRAGSA